MSATQSNCVHPHLVRSRLTLATFAAGMPHGVLGSMRLTGGPNVFTTFVLTASADRYGNTLSTRAPRLTTLDGVTSVGVFFPRCWYDRASDTPVVTSSFTLTPHPPSWVLQSSRTPLRPFGVGSDTSGSEDAEITKTTVDAFS